jgi:hypothetical protein
MHGTPLCLLAVSIRLSPASYQYAAAPTGLPGGLLESVLQLG